MRREFDPLRERLLRAGIGSAHAGRYIAELRDHLDDLVAEEQRAGRSARDAYSHAMQRLGDADALAESMIVRREFQAWSARAPVAAYVVAPPVILTLATAVWVVGLVAACTWLRHTTGEPSDLPAWTVPAADGAARFSNATLSVLLGWALAATAIRQRAPVLWPMLGLIALATLGAALQVDVTLPAGGAPGEINLRPEFSGSPLGLSGYWGRFVLDLAATATPFALLSLWRAAHAAEGHS
jgi:hypothetical protein